MNSYKTLSLYLLLATPVLSIDQRSSTAPDIDTTTNKMDAPTDMQPKHIAMAAEILQQAKMPKLFGRKQTKQTSDTEKRRIENEISQKRKDIAELTREIANLHTTNCIYKQLNEYVTIQPNIPSQLNEAERRVRNGDIFLGEFQALERRDSNYRNVALLVAAVNGAAYLAATVGIRPVEMAVEKIPYSDVIMPVVEFFAIGGAYLAQSNYRGSSKYAQDTKKELETDSAHLSTLKQAASELAKLEAEKTKLENEVEQLNLDLLNLK